MRRLTTVCSVSLLLWAVDASAQETVQIGRDARGFHEEQFHDARIRLEPPAVTDVEILVELIGIPNAAKINALRLQIRRSFGIKNALAFYGQGFRSIAYDPDWAATATPEFYLVLGHEAGHLFCRHDVGGGAGTRIEQELEADRFAGASIKRFERYHNRSFFAAVLNAAATRYPDQGSTLYPSRAARLKALRTGYAEGSPCGDLAPVEQSGFVPPGTKR